MLKDLPTLENNCLGYEDSIELLLEKPLDDLRLMVNHEEDDLVLVEESAQVAFELFIHPKLNSCSLADDCRRCYLCFCYPLKLLSLICITRLDHSSLALLDDHLVRTDIEVVSEIVRILGVFEGVSEVV